MAGASLVHHPTSSTFLLTDPNYLPDETVQELMRLRPQGDNLPAQVFLVGPVDRAVQYSLESLGFSVLPVGSNTNPFSAAVDIARLRLEVIPPEGETGRSNIIITSGEYYGEGLPAPSFAAHMGTPILFVRKNQLTSPTENFIRMNPNKNYFILGSTETISMSVENAIKNLAQGIVERIPGNSPYEISINFARFHRPEAADFGWNRSQPGQGDAFNFAPIHKWENAIMSALQGHEGKHTPELTVTMNILPNEIKSYLEFLRPRKPMPMPPFMHGFIQGNFMEISFGVQVEIEKSIIFKEE